MSNLKKSYCPICMTNCAAKVTVIDNKVTKIQSDFDDPVSKGYTCEMMQRVPDMYNSSKQKQITKPYKKVDGVFVPISWEQAINEISTKLKSVINTLGGDKIFYMYHDAAQHLTSEYSFKFFSELGVKYYYNVISFEKVHTPTASNMMFGNPLAEPDIENSDVLMIVGKNIWVSNQVEANPRTIINNIKKDSRKKLIVVDPVVNETTKLSDIHIQLKPGTDSWFLLAILKHLHINNKLTKNPYPGLNELVQGLDQVDVDDYLETCNVSREQMLAVVEAIVSTDRFSILSELGVNYSINQFKTTYYSYLIQVLTGNFNRPGGLIFKRNFLPTDYSKASDRPNTTPITKEPIFCGVMPSNSLADNLDYFNALFMCSYVLDPASHAPDKDKVRQAISRVPLKIGVALQWNETTQLMDYVLPVCDQFLVETNIKPTLWKNTIKLNDSIFELPDEAKRLEDIIDLLNERLCPMDNYSQKLQEYEILFATDIEQFIKKLLIDESHFTQIKLSKDIVGQQFKWPWLGALWLKLVVRYKSLTREDLLSILELVKKLENNKSVKLPDEQMNYTVDFTVPGSKVLELDKSQLINSNYSFVLSCGFRRKHTLNNTITDNQHWVEIFPTDAEQLDIQEGSAVLVQTNIGQIETICKIADWMQPGYVRMPNFKNINFLTDSGEIGSRELNPNYKFQFANIKKL